MKEHTIRGYWLVTNLCLATGLFFWPPALFAAMAVTALHCVHFMIHEPRVSLFPMQVRLGYLGLLILGQFSYIQWINWVQLIGTTALLTTGYCPLARLLCLLPWNSPQPISWKYIAKVLFSPPVPGSIVQAMSTDKLAVFATTTLRRTTMPLVKINVIENVFTPEQKTQMIEKITDAMVAIEGEAMRGAIAFKKKKLDEIMFRLCEIGSI